MPRARRIDARARIPSTTIRLAPLQNLQVTLPGSKSARVRIPRTVVGPAPLQDFQMALVDRARARGFVPGASLQKKTRQNTSQTKNCSCAPLQQLGSPSTKFITLLNSHAIAHENTSNSNRSDYHREKNPVGPSGKPVIQRVRVYI